MTVAQLDGEQRDQLRACGIPFVVFDPTVELPADVPFAGATNWAGGRSAARHLVELGHRRIAMIGGPGQILCCRARMDGFRSTLEAAGLGAACDLSVDAGLNIEEGEAAALGLLARTDRSTAILACNDLQALGVYQAARRMGLRNPGLGVVGLDDLPLATLVDPPLTTVHQPLAEMAATATELALTLARGSGPRSSGLSWRRLSPFGGAPRRQPPDRKRRTPPTLEIPGRRARPGPVGRSVSETSKMALKLPLAMAGSFWKSSSINQSVSAHIDR